MAEFIAQDCAIGKDFFGEKEAHGCHYIDWENGDGNSPKILDEFDYQKLVTSSMLFARKFDWGFSQRLIKKIDENILHIA